MLNTYTNYTSNNSRNHLGIISEDMDAFVHYLHDQKCHEMF